MLTTNDAAALLAATAADPLAAIATALGFADGLRVPPATRRSLGLADAAVVRVAEGEGALRALLVEWEGRAPLRDVAAGLCRALARGSPSQRWLLVARDRARQSVVLAAPPATGRGAVPALVVDTRRVRESDAETLAALVASRTEPGFLRHLRWSEVLGRDGLTRRFYRDLERCVEDLASSATGRASAADRRTISVLHASRILFLAFLEARGLLDRDRAFLRRAFAARCGGRGAHHRFLEPLFFGTLNTPAARRAPAARAFGRVPFLNGGLFTRTPVETRARDLRFTDAALGALVGDLLGRYRLTARETTAEWSEAAVDPEMLGRAFESLMAGGARRAGGVFYTPQPLIERLTRRALGALESPRGDPLAALLRLRVLDPACGSGAFLVFALHELAARRIAAGDDRPVAAVRRDVLTRSIFGVDRDPTAVWLCQLRLWLSLAVEDEAEDGRCLAPLPNLDRNVREGDALAGPAFDALSAVADDLEPLRLRYVRATGARKRSFARLLDREERRRAVAAAEERARLARAARADLLASVRSRDLFAARPAPDAATRARLATWRATMREATRAARVLRDGGALPFSFPTHFPALAREGGVHLVLGNPPWVRTHRIPGPEREILRAHYECLRDAAWRAGADPAAAGRGFASQADLAALFTERAARLARPGGVIALLLPAKLWGALAGGGIRQLLAREAPPLALDLWDGSDAGFDAVVYPSALLARRPGDATARPPAAVAITRHRERSTDEWEVARGSLALDPTPGAPWLLLPPEVRRAFDRLVAVGCPLADTPFGRPLLGVKSGCNAAFVVRRAPATGEQAFVRVSSGDRAGVVDRESLKPLLRGEHVRPFGRSTDAADTALVWPHDANGVPWARLPAATRAWLLHWRRELEDRSDSRGARWWSLFRTESARSRDPRVVWSDIGRVPRAVVVAAGDPTVPLNSCYVVRAPSDDDAHALAALLNSEVAGCWLRALAEPARGGYRRFLGWTCARLPVPRAWTSVRGELAALGRAATTGPVPDGDALTQAVCRAFGVDPAELRPLLEWDPG